MGTALVHVWSSASLLTRGIEGRSAFDEPPASLAAGFRSAGVIKHFSRILSRLSTLIKNTRVQKIVLHKRGTSYPTIGKKRLRKRHANRTTEEELGNQQRQAGGAVMCALSPMPCNMRVKLVDASRPHICIEIAGAHHHMWMLACQNIWPRTEW